MRSWIVAGLIAGMTSAGWAQSESASAAANRPVLPHLQIGPDRHVDSFNPSSEEAAQSVYPPVSANLWSRQAPVPSPTFWSESRAGQVDNAGGVSLVRFDLPDARSSQPSDWKIELPRASDADGEREDSPRTGFKASDFVPLDSWIYDALDRLAAMGLLPTSTAIIRPWTRLECARLLAEAHDSLDTEPDAATAPLLAALDVEFAHETNVIEGVNNNVGAQVESAYERFTDIAGTPLRDGFHFGQTLVDDYGRPYGEGANSITGLSGVP